MIVIVIIYIVSNSLNFLLWKVGRYGEKHGTLKTIHEGTTTIKMFKIQKLTKKTLKN